MVLPISFAEATLPPTFFAPLPSLVLALTMVLPDISSINCTYMWLSERYTFNRGRSDVPSIFSRIRLCTRRRVASFEISGIIISSQLSVPSSQLCETAYQSLQPAPPGTKSDVAAKTQRLPL